MIKVFYCGSEEDFRTSL